jgi:hypothetical protein
MKSLPLLLTTLAWALLAGCSTTGLSPREQPGKSMAGIISSLLENRTNDAPARKLSFPLRLAVAQIGESAPPQKLISTLEKEPFLFSQVSALPLWVDVSGNASNQVTGLRALAWDVNADHLLVIGGNIDTVETSNFLSLLDVTVIGGAIFPSREISSEGRANGLLVDVATGQTVMFTSTDLKKTTSTPSYFAGDRSTTQNRDLRDKLLAKLGQDFVQQLRQRSPAMAGGGRP